MHPKPFLPAAVAMLAIGVGLITINVGCVASQAEATRDRLIQRGYSAAYADGFSHGLQSGKAAAGNPYASMQKDPRRYRDENQYKQGYDDGFAQGKGEYDAIRQSVNSL